MHDLSKQFAVLQALTLANADIKQQQGLLAAAQLRQQAAVHSTATSPVWPASQQVRPESLGRHFQRSC